MKVIPPDTADHKITLCRPHPVLQPQGTGCPHSAVQRRPGCPWFTLPGTEGCWLSSLPFCEADTLSCRHFPNQPRLGLFPRLTLQLPRSPRKFPAWLSDGSSGRLPDLSLLPVCTLSHKVMSSRPHGLWPSRLLSPLDFPRQEYWSGLLFPPAGTVPDPGIESASPPLEGNFLTTGPPEKQGIAIYPFVHVPCQQMGSGHCCARPFLSSWCPRAEPARGSALRLQGAWEGRQETETSYVLLTRWKVMRGKAEAGTGCENCRRLPNTGRGQGRWPGTDRGAVLWSLWPDVDISTVPFNLCDLGKVT